MSLLSKRWHIAPDFIVRRTGFPFERLESLRFNNTAGAVRDLIQLEQKIELESQRLLDGVMHQAVGTVRQDPQRHRQRTVLTKVRKELHKQKSISEAIIVNLDDDFKHLLLDKFNKWNQMITERKELDQNAKSEFCLELERKRKLLNEVVLDDTFREAVFLSNRGFDQTGIEYYLRHNKKTSSRASKLRQIETTLAAYLQRFCAKNDTTSFFGPINYARLHPDQLSSLEIELTPEPLRRRVTFFAYWAAVELAKVIGQDPDINVWLALHKNPLCRDKGSERIHFSLLEKDIKIPSRLMKIFQSADGELTSKEIANLLEIDQKEVEESIQSLTQGKILLRQIHIPPSEFHGLQAIIRQLEALPEFCSAKQRWLEVLVDLEQLRQDFSTADLDDRRSILRNVESQFERFTGQAAVRNPGKMYADRTLLYEECLGNMRRVGLSEAMFSQIADMLSLPLRVATLYAQLLKVDLNDRTVPIYDEIRGDSKNLTYTKFAAAFNQMVNRGSEMEYGWRTKQFLKLLWTSVDRVERSGRASFTKADLDFLDEFDCDNGGMLASPDIMFAASSLEAINAGEFTLVLAEIHDNITLWDTLMYFHPNKSDVEKYLNENLIESGAYPDLAWIQFSRDNKCMALKLPGKTIEMIVPTEKNAFVLPVSDLIVDRENGEFVLRSRSSGCTYKLYCGLTHTVAEHVLSLPKILNIPWIRNEAHTPRIDIEGVVVQRERWIFDSAAFNLSNNTGDEFDLFLSLQRFRARHQLPEHIFVWIPKEPKPIYIDFNNHFLLRLLANAIRRGGQLIVEEMLPSPDQMWLIDKTGRHCAELRTTAFYY